MPTYTYRCDHCQTSHDVFQRITEDPIQECPQCHEKTLRRVIHGGAGIIFKGTGFYCTDYRSKTYMSQAKSDQYHKETKDSPKQATPEPSKKTSESSAASEAVAAAS